MFFNFNVLFPITPFSRNFYGVKSVQCPVSTQGVVRIYPEGAYVTIGNPAICLFLSTGLHFRDELQYGCDVSQQKIKYQNSRKWWCHFVRRTICPKLPANGGALTGVGFLYRVGLCIVSIRSKAFGAGYPDIRSKAIRGRTTSYTD